MEGAEVEFTPDALQEIAKMAKAKDTGARGLRSIVEDIMLDIMFELPDRAAKDKGKFMVTGEVVRKERASSTRRRWRSPLRSVRARNAKRKARKSGRDASSFVFFNEQGTSSFLRLYIYKRTQPFAKRKQSMSALAQPLDGPSAIPDTRAA